MKIHQPLSVSLCKVVEDKSSLQRTFIKNFTNILKQRELYALEIKFKLVSEELEKPTGPLSIMMLLLISLLLVKLWVTASQYQPLLQQNKLLKVIKTEILNFSAPSEEILWQSQPQLQSWMLLNGNICKKMQEILEST